MTRVFFRSLILVCALTSLSACISTQVGSIYRSSTETAPIGRDIFVTIDGTGNSPVSRTNAARLFEMVDSASHLRGSRELATYYAEGVGSEGEFLGLAAGAGMSADIRNAYKFLTRTYRPGDRIFLSGFSRGAFGARALNGMIAVAGIPDLSDKPTSDQDRIVKRLFRAYKITRRKGHTHAQHFERRLERVTAIYLDERIEPHGLDHAVPIAAMALWDTVEAMGWPDYTARPDERDRHYYLTNCNVNHIFHALALDDNRAYSFTPIFAQGARNYALCPEKEATAHIEEVWFSGAHADVGGSYAPGDMIDGHLQGVSLNWMLKRISPFGLVPKGSHVFADENGPIHDAKDFSGAYALLSRYFRYPLEYHGEAGVETRPAFHRSAVRRLARAIELDDYHPQCSRLSSNATGPTLLCGRDLDRYGPVAELKERNCITRGERGYSLVPDQKCINIVD